jgi:uncharacterized spore protein YtfJ
MKTEIEEAISKVMGFLKDEAKTETVIGTQFTLGEFLCVPVIRIGMGFGFGEGGGEDTKNGKGEGGGAGAGTGIEPIGFLVTRNEMINFIPTHTSKGLAAMFEKAPEMFGKFFEMKDGKKQPVGTN